MITVNARKRRGNLILIVVMVAVVATLLSTVLVRTVNSMRVVGQESEAVMGQYDLIAFSDVAACAFREDMSAWWNHIAELGELTSSNSLSTYSAIIEDINNNYFTEVDGKYIYNVDDLSKIFEYITFDTNTSGNMNTRLKESEKGITQFRIELENKLELNEAMADLQTKEWESDLTEIENISPSNIGDVIPLKDIVFQITIKRGQTRVIQRYRLSGLEATFTDISGGVHCIISNENAKLNMLSQRIN